MNKDGTIGIRLSKAVYPLIGKYESRKRLAQFPDRRPEAALAGKGFSVLLMVRCRLTWKEHRFYVRLLFKKMVFGNLYRRIGVLNPLEQAAGWYVAEEEGTIYLTPAGGIRENYCEERVPFT